MLSPSVVYGTNYAVTEGTPPVGQTCAVTGGSGTDVMANVTGVSVACVTVPTYTVSGAIYSLGFGVNSFQLYDTVNSSTTFVATFSANGSGIVLLTGIPSGGSYSLSTVPTCFILNATASNVTNVRIDFAPP